MRALEVPAPEVTKRPRARLDKKNKASRGQLFFSFAPCKGACFSEL